MLKFLSVLLFPLSVLALPALNVDEPTFDFKTPIPYAQKTIRYDVIFDTKGDAKLVENTTEEKEETTENKKSKVLLRETLSFSPKQKTLSEQAQKTIQNLTDTMKRNKGSHTTITLFFYSGSGFETAESKRLALKRSLAIKKEMKKYQIGATRMFIQIKETATKHTSHIAHIILKSQ